MVKIYDITVDCAVCASDCQKAISKIKGVNSCEINFILQKMILDVDDDNFDGILKQILKSARKIEPDFEISE